MKAAALIRELGQLLRGWHKLATVERRPLEVLRVEGAQDLEAELCEAVHGVKATAYAAEVSDREALRLIDSATRPDSDGGATITPLELAKVRRLVSRSAELDHDVAEALTL